MSYYRENTWIFNKKHFKDLKKDRMGLFIVFIRNGKIFLTIREWLDKFEHYHPDNETLVELDDDYGHVIKLNSKEIQSITPMYYSYYNKVIELIKNKERTGYYSFLPDDLPIYQYVARTEVFGTDDEGHDWVDTYIEEFKLADGLKGNQFLGDKDE